MTDAALQPASLAVTPRTTLKRHPERGSHERALIDAILDEALLCHVAVNVDGAPRVLPTAHVRVGDHVYLHGARANRVLGALTSGAPACLTVTLLDGLVFARSAFSHSMNFRSAVLYGAASEVTDLEEKHAALCALVDHMAQGRSLEARAPNEDELRTTLVVKWPIVEGSAKLRSGPPLDREPDLERDCWAGVLAVRLQALAPEADPRLVPSRAPSPAVGARAALLSPFRLAPYERVHEREPEVCVSCDPGRVDFAFVHRFLAEESYWARGVDAQLQARSMQQSLGFGLYRGAEQIGFARVVTDFGRFAYLGDVFVAEGERGRGLGTWLVQCVLEHPALAGIERWLLGTAEAHGLYERFGFVTAPAQHYMVRRAEKAGA